jgi:hypothetical protein
VNRRGSTVRPLGTCAVGASLGGTNTSSLAFPPYNLTVASASTAVISLGLTGRTTKKAALLPPYTTGSVRISFQSRHKAGANRRAAMASCRSKVRVAVRALVKTRERTRRRIRRRTLSAHR